MSRVKAASSPASPPLTSGSVGVMVEKRRYRSNRYRLIPVSAVYTRGERLHKIRDRPRNRAIFFSEKIARFAERVPRGIACPNIIHFFAQLIPFSVLHLPGLLLATLLCLLRFANFLITTCHAVAENDVMCHNCFDLMNMNKMQLLPTIY